jgi:hypothetical protein
LRRRRRADEHGFVRHIDGQAIGVGFGIDDGRLDTEPARGADNADGDFAAVGDQDFIEHWGVLTHVYSANVSFPGFPGTQGQPAPSAPGSRIPLTRIRE